MGSVAVCGVTVAGVRGCHMCSLPIGPVKGYPYWDCMSGSGRLA
jgi:hypothetical protein